MCQREQVGSLQTGMHFGINRGYSVLLMSRRLNAPYQDQILDDGQTLEYEGHDVGRTSSKANPKRENQPRSLNSGKPTQNGLFAEAVDKYKAGEGKPEIVRVYEKIIPGIWSDKGLFKLLDYQYVRSGSRKVFRFYLKAIADNLSKQEERLELPTKRLIPTDVKKEVWDRDQGRCVLCGETNNLHFDHDIPWSKGGSSINPENVKILCVRHNLQKSDKIE